MLLIPAAVGTLMLHQPFDAVIHAAGGGVAAGQQSQDAPSGLRRSAGSRRKSLVVVAGAAFAPASVGVLNGAEPFAGANNVPFAIAFPGGAQPSQGQEGAIHVIHAPTPVPASVDFLSTLEVFDGSADRRLARADAAGHQGLKHPAGDIRTGGIEHRIVIGKWYGAEEMPVIVDVEGGPAAIGALHRQQPVHGPANAGFLLG